MDLTWGEVALRLLLATVLSGVIGIERQLHGKPAGFRTNALVGLGAAAMSLVGVVVANMFPSDGISIDPTRLASIVIQGVGFICAGTIIQSRGEVHGLTTAATLWSAAGVGIACGFGLWIIASITTILVLILLILFSQVDFEAEQAEHGKGKIKFFRRK